MVSFPATSARRRPAQLLHYGSPWNAEWGVSGRMESININPVTGPKNNKLRIRLVGEDEEVKMELLGITQELFVHITT